MSFIYFQCEYQDVQQGDKTLHLFEHLTKHSPDHMQTELMTWIKDHKYWIEVMSTEIIGKKKITLDDYLSLCEPGTPVNEI